MPWGRGRKEGRKEEKTGVNLLERRFPPDPPPRTSIIVVWCRRCVWVSVQRDKGRSAASYAMCVSICNTKEVADSEEGRHLDLPFRPCCLAVEAHLCVRLSYRLDRTFVLLRVTPNGYRRLLSGKQASPGRRSPVSSPRRGPRTGGAPA